MESSIFCFGQGTVGLGARRPVLRLRASGVVSVESVQDGVGHGTTQRFTFQSSHGGRLRSTIRIDLYIWKQGRQRYGVYVTCSTEILRGQFDRCEMRLNRWQSGGRAGA